jgi:hypothetical protein
MLSGIEPERLFSMLIWESPAGLLPIELRDMISNIKPPDRLRNDSDDAPERLGV